MKKFGNLKIINFSKSLDKARNPQGNGLIMFRVENFDKKIMLGDTELSVSAPSWWRRQDPKTLSFGICDDFRHADYESFSYNY